MECIADFLPGYEASAWVGFGAPKNTPAAIIETLNKQFNAAIGDPTVKKRLAELGAVAMPPNTPAEFARYMAADAEKWAKVIKASGIRPE
jgi:tripartite-type tricarboxylate transporter receptor subunit TctC